MVASEWEQAGAVVDRLLAAHPRGRVGIDRDANVERIIWATFEPTGGMLDAFTVAGPTVTAALIDLGRQWAQEGRNCPERDEGDAHE